jgi:hypothetical protein
MPGALTNSSQNLAASHNPGFSKTVLFEPFLICVASKPERYHPSRRLASTRWVPANTQK